MAATHISISELPPRIRALVDDLRAGEEIIIDSGEGPVAVLRAPGRPKAKTLGEAIARFEERERELGHPIVMDEDYARDMREIIANRKPRDTSAWD
jgi:antitoxin (DNA-binding transcriptional repressor) of toxin-antitoxin stability system